jgi:hypothetical protein
MQLQTTASAISFSCCSSIFFGSVWKIRKAEFYFSLSNLHRSPKVGKKKEKNNIIIIINNNNNNNNFKAIAKHNCECRAHTALLHAQNFFLKILKIIL